MIGLKVMVNSDLAPNPSGGPLPLVCAVSYLNTVPLVWGALRGPQRGTMDLSFAVPSVCARRVEEGVVDVGILPVIETARMGLEFIPDIGIACRGAVRSLLLISRVPFDQVKSLAADVGSRTTVELARIILAHRYGAEPAVFPAAPQLGSMLRDADAALLIGDAALSVNPLELDYPVLDLGEEWMALTGLPMVTALWAGHKKAITPELAGLLRESCRFGLASLEQIIQEESSQRDFPEWLVRDYLTRHIVYEIGESEHAGLKLYLEYARELANPALKEAQAHP